MDDVIERGVELLYSTDQFSRSEARFAMNVLLANAVFRPGDEIGEMVVVPKEATREMVDAANEREREVGITTAAKMGNPAMRLHYSEAYRVMVATTREG